ncbi:MULTISPECIES: crotonase/enoyl-CoA hydratase family protein [Dietzia]|uniref:Crotonase/enoyl-CoA hydratase family protein n=2 Tax=Dietzia TaxID=37914 RepID=A0AAE4U585_9ACTN|nr:MULTISPECIES: crotonase/enoyl-CoA hydratase family protein [Dietzia]MVZ90419.1 crotonase/enoyl-CoA hydratase family protein [Microbacter sp. ANSKLAB05]MBB1012589.1 crotonase/enoyl-CoA hydratase family protein [Dietzia kunjamensis]MBB1014021.1 crotonase/enoyl-CoA hydratase family protein [Dietzia kunjamensis subsp. schimae]MDV6299562.1 crotonase/enoyl-CoA hydratase family protein [Dietzia maris]RKE65335.1 enoyl-CoA hydratase/carnithine racemase [Dietzia kunjamensis]
MTTAPLLVERADHIETWTMNLPDSRNPISDPAIVDALCDQVATVNGDHDVRAVVLTGAGSAFSAGGNVKDMVDRAGMFGGSPYELRDGYRRGIQRIPRALYHCEVPVVAAVNGPAVGAGCDLAVMCDLRVASTRAWFAESFVQLGIIPGDGGAWLLTKAIGPARAAEMALTGDRVKAEQAAAWGLVNEVVEPDQLLEAAHTLAARVAKNPPHSVRMAKKLLRESQHQSLESLLELSAAMQALAHHAEDHREALAAFGDKRAGEYTGR